MRNRRAGAGPHDMRKFLANMLQIRNECAHEKDWVNKKALRAFDSPIIAARAGNVKRPHPKGCGRL